MVALSTLSNEFRGAVSTELALEEPSLLVWWCHKSEIKYKIDGVISI
jgi:hypothetical protein